MKLMSVIIFHARLSSSNSFIVHIICLPTLDYQINSHIKLGSWVKKRPGRKNFLWMDRSHKLCVYLKKTLLKCVFGGHQLHTTWTKKLEESTLNFFFENYPHIQCGLSVYREYQVLGLFSENL